MLVAIIGTRSITHQHPYGQALARLTRQLSQQGHTIVTGGAKGVDQIAMSNSNQCIVYLPWASYESEAVAQYATQTVVFNPKVHVDWLDSVGQHHPAPERLTQGAKNLHARNFGIISGADCVIALPSDNDGGGTGQGMRLALALGKPLFNLRYRDDIEAMHTFFNN